MYRQFFGYNPVFTNKHVNQKNPNDVADNLEYNGCCFAMTILRSLCPGLSVRSSLVMLYNVDKRERLPGPFGKKCFSSPVRILFRRGTRVAKGGRL